MKRSRPRPTPPGLRDQKDEAFRESHHRRPKAQERKVAGAIGGLTTPGSGAFGGHKGDVKRDVKSFPLLVECKRSMGKQSISLQARHLIKITDEALTTGAYPALALQFDRSVMDRLSREQGHAPASVDWVAVPLTVFSAMLEALGEEGLGL